MAHSTATVVRAIRAAFPADGPPVHDGELLRRFAEEGDQDAFAAVVRRHAGLVFGVCRRALPTVQDAEDACQATFLVLAQKARGQPWGSSVAGYLYATARQVVGNARQAAYFFTRAYGFTETAYKGLETGARDRTSHVLDSMDALLAMASNKKFAKRKQATRGDGEEIKGSYGMDKPKENSESLRRALAGLRKTGSILIVISQTRDNIGFGAMFQPKTRSGGHALVGPCEVARGVHTRAQLDHRVRGGAILAEARRARAARTLDNAAVQEPRRPP